MEEKNIEDVIEEVVEDSVEESVEPQDKRKTVLTIVAIGAALVVTTYLLRVIFLPDSFDIEDDFPEESSVTVTDVVIGDNPPNPGVIESLAEQTDEVTEPPVITEDAPPPEELNPILANIALLYPNEVVPNEIVSRQDESVDTKTPSAGDSVAGMAIRHIA